LTFFDVKGDGLANDPKLLILQGIAAAQPSFHKN
jgi:hypothetical protein